MFIGPINTDTRILLKEMLPEFGSLPVYVGCSGNFTVERLLAQSGINQVTSNDVSLYTTAIGNYLMRRPMRIDLKDENFNWLKGYLTDGESQIATLLICSEYFKFIYSELPYYKRQAAAYRSQFTKLHGKTAARVKERLSDVRLKEYVCEDVVEYAKKVPSESVFVAFPPTYKGGYERLYRKINEVFDWDAPSYPIFDDESYEKLKMEAKSKRKWLLLRDKCDESEEENLVAEFQPASTTKTVFVYSNMKKCRVTKPQKKFDEVLLERATGELKGDLRLIRLTVGQINTLRSEYMSRTIAFPGAPDVVIGICDGGKIFGVLGFRKIAGYYREMADVYMVADFCVGPSIYKRLSKLVLCVALSDEVKEILEAEFQCPIKKIFTTVFTEKAVSMKYRGLFEIFNRKEDRSALNYVSETGRWDLKGAFEFWKKKYAS